MTPRPDSHRDENSKMELPLADYPSDQLLRFWKNGDDRAAGILFDRYAIRLVTLVASRLSRRFRDTVDPDDIVQSAMGSFFCAVRESRIHVSSSLSFWRLLATFTRRKMARSIEKQNAAKRGGDCGRLPFEAIERWQSKFSAEESNEPAEELMAAIESELSQDQQNLLTHLLSGANQKEIAKAFGVDERTIRRRVALIRETLSPPASAKEESENNSVMADASSLPPISYREFVLGKLIGSGGFGKVYRASMQSDGEIVAVKFLRKAFWSHAQAKQSFIREIDLAAQVNHPGIATYLGWGQSPHGGPYVVSRWVDGQSMEQLGTIERKRFIHLLHQICGAIQAVHEAGLVHGDLSPSNILVDRNDRVTIADFGFSQRWSKTSQASSDSLLGGTIGFAAPEQLSPAFGQISPRTDLYAIGGIAYWYLTGARPHAADTIEQAIFNTISNTETSIPVAEERLAAIRKIAREGLAKSPSRRPSDASAWMTLLETSG